MKTTTLFQLGGIALLGSVLVYAISNLTYFLSGEPEGPTMIGVLAGLIGDTVFVLGLGALYARQAQRAGILGLVGYILLMVAQVYFFGSYAVNLGILGGALTVQQVQQVPAYALTSSIFPWLWFAGLIVFGIAIFRAGVYPKYAGVLLILTALLQQLSGYVPFAGVIFAIVSLSAWAWLGWSLLTNKGLDSQESKADTQTRLASGRATN